METNRIKVGLFRADSTSLHFKAGEIIFEEGASGNEMFVLRKGQVALRVGEKTLATIEEDETFGEMALIDKHPRSATAVAATDCEVVPVDSRRFLFLVQQTPNFALLMLQILAQRLRTMDREV